MAASEPTGDRRAHHLKPSRPMHPERPAARQAEIEAAESVARLLLWTYPRPLLSSEASTRGA